MSGMSGMSSLENTKICRFFSTKGGCREGDKCRFRHIKENNVTNHKDNKNKNKNKNNKKNTECFSPSFKSSDMTVKIVCASCESSYPHSYQPRDVVLVTDLFRDLQNKENEYDIYERILYEINNGPTFMTVIERLKSYFKIDAKATRLNWFSDKNEWKPYHFDAAAVDPEKAKVQNFTVGVSVGVSFGDTREVSFQHAKTKTTVNFPLQDGTVYCFGSQVNIEWRHGIPPIQEEKFEKGRISIIIWGWVNMEE